MKTSSIVVVAEEALVLLDERVLRLRQDLDEIVAAQLVHGRDDRQAADELGDQAEVEQVLRHHVRRAALTPRAECFERIVGAEADRVLADAPRR